MLKPSEAFDFCLLGEPAWPFLVDVDVGRGCRGECVSERTSHGYDRSGDADSFRSTITGTGAGVGTTPISEAVGESVAGL